MCDKLYRMKRICVLIICMLLLLPATPVLSASADEEKAENLTEKCTFEFGDYRYASSRILRESEHYQIFEPNDSFSVTWEETFDGARLCLRWQEQPNGVRILQYDANDMLLSEDAVPAFYETVTQLLPEARKAVVQSGDAGMQVGTCAVYGAGELPEPYHDWEPTPDHLDYLLIWMTTCCISEAFRRFTAPNRGM